MTGSNAAGVGKKLDRFGTAYFERRHAVLFFSLLLSMAVAPVLSALHLGSGPLEFFILLNILLAGMSAEKSARKSLLLALAITAGIRLLGLLLNSKGIDAGGSFALAALVLVATLGAFRFAMRSRVVDLEHVYAALNAYLLAGHFFGILASTLEEVAPGSYTGAPMAAAGIFPTSQAIYFSFVTLATLGYGDIVPATDIARGIALVEAVAGQLYIAVLVARLVGGYASRDKV